jgi:peptidoglycan/LPS O-acetylase OafA/YrhL
MIQNPLKSLIAACSSSFVLYFISAFQNKMKCNVFCITMRFLGMYSYEIFLVHGIGIFCFAEIFVGNALINIALLFVLTSIGVALLKITEQKLRI